MAGAYVTVYTESNGDGVVSSIPCTVSGATAGNLLVASLNIRGSTTGITDPVTGWTKREESAGGTGLGTHVVYTRVATGDANDNVPTISWTTAFRAFIAVAEFSGLDGTAPYEDSDDATQGNTNTANSSVGTGTATATSANGTAVFVLNPYEWDDADDTLALSVGTVDYYRTTGSTVRPGVSFGHLNYTSAGSKSATWSWASETTNAYGAVLVFKEAAASGGVTVVLSGQAATVGRGTITVSAAAAVDVTGQAVTAGQGISTVSAGAGAGFTVTDVDLDETITEGQTGVVITITGTVAATGKKVFIMQGANSVEQTVTAENTSSATITVTYGGLLTSGAATLSVRNPL